MEEIGVPYETVLIDLQNKPPEFVELYTRANPLPGANAVVPVLEVIEDSFVLTESLVVAEYLAEAFPEAGLVPASARGRATMRLFLELCGSSFSYFGILRAHGDDEAFASAIAALREGLIRANAFLERRGDPGGPFLFGDRFTLAECGVAPFVQFACNLSAFTDVDPVAMCEEEGLSRLKEWMVALVGRPSVKSIEVPKDEMMASVMRLRKRWAAMK